MHSGNQVVARVLSAFVMTAAVAADAREKSPASPAPVDAPAVSAAMPRSHLQPVGEMVRQSAGVGLRMARAPQVLREQLALERGAGLVVEAVQPDSAADRAGFMVNDVLVRVDDQLMLLPEQFAALVEASAGDAKLACHLLRGGKPVVIPLRGGAADAAAETVAVAASTTLQPAASTLARLPHPSANDAPVPPVPKATAPLDASASAPPEILVRNDADYQLRLTVGDETRLVVTDRQGRLVFNDCIDTPEARSRLPRAVRDRVAHMERHLEQRDAKRHRPVAEIGRLDVPPIRIR